MNKDVWNIWNVHFQKLRNLTNIFCWTSPFEYVLIPADTVSDFVHFKKIGGNAPSYDFEYVLIPADTVSDFVHFKKIGGNAPSYDPCP